MGAANSDLSVGTEFAGYRITGVIGHGGMSSVYLAEHIRLGRPVALKVLSPVLAADEAFRSRFKRESQLAAALDHPSIITIYDAGEGDGMLYIAMRLVEGDDLGGVLRRDGPLSFARTLSILEQVGSALDHANAKGLIHRDVKPANILIERPSERAYLTDFGVVKETSSRGLTKTGYFLGTFEYAAPEQIEGREVDRRTDVYALGCVLYESLTAEAPFGAKTEGSVIHAHLIDPPPKATAKRPDLPAAINDVIAIAMAKAMEERYATCGELVRALQAIGQVSSASRAGELSAPGVSQGATVLASTALPPRPASVAEAAPVHPDDGAVDGGPTAVVESGSAATGEQTTPLPPQTGKQRTFVLTPRRAIAAGILVAALVAAGIAAALLLGGNGTTTVSSRTPTTTGSAATSGPQAAVGVSSVVPTPLFRYCKISAPTNGASQTVACIAPSGSTSFWPDSWSFSFYPSTAEALKAYNALRVQSGIGRDFGRCDRTSWSGEGIWLHNPDPGAPPKTGGRRFCYFQGNVAVIVWLHEKLAQPNHIDMIGVARASGSDHFNLFGWYSFWHHTVGKCLAPGCVARLS